MTLKCALINPVQLVCPPFGLLHIASVLEAEGCTVMVTELPSRHMVDYKKSITSMIENLKKFNPDMIGITCMAAQRSEVMDIIKSIKAHEFSAKVVVGGVHASFMPEEVMGWGADYAVLNEGEETVTELLEAIKGNKHPSGIKGIFYRDNGNVRQTEKRPFIEDLNKLPLPAYHLIDRRRFTTRKGEVRGRWSRSGWIMTSRGCPSSCIFCCAHRMFGKSVRYRSIEHIFSEIRSLVENFNIETLVLMDDTFTVNKEIVFAFCKKIKEEFPQIKWSCQARVNLFDEEFARILKDANCIQVDFGVESGSQKVLNRIRKGIKVEDTVRAFDACKKFGLRTLATIMVGNPEEELDDLEKTRTLLKRIKPDFYAAYYTTPFPGTELYEEVKAKKLIDDSNRYWHQYTKPIMLSKVAPEVLNNTLRDFTRIGVIRNYLINPVFLFDMAKFAVLNPMLGLRVCFNLLRGHVEKALFLITNSVYFKRQG